MINNYSILAMQSIVHGCQFSWGEPYNYENIEWLDERPCPTKEEWEAEKLRLVAKQPLKECEQKAQTLLNESDWTDLYTVRNKLENVTEWDTYRDIIRDLRINPIENPTFPNKPQTIWQEIIPIPIDEPIINNEETII